MKKLKLYYATNRNHEGNNRWRPDSYGRRFSQDGMENLRFGRVALEVDEKQISRFVNRKAHEEKGDGNGLADYLTKQAKSFDIQAYREKLAPGIADIEQEDAKLGSLALFADLQKEMFRSSDVLIYVHGFNVHWDQAVGSGLALQEMLNRPGISKETKRVLVVLFTWPSDGKALPFVSYKSDRSEARGSGYAVGRGFLKLRDFLIGLRDRATHGGHTTREICDQDLHLLCHSMGNYVLQNALGRLQEFTPGRALPRLFQHIFMCAPDVDEDVLEEGKPMGRLHETTRYVNVYYNTGDIAMYVSDYTKGNTERLGTNGAPRPSLLHQKVHQVDCSDIVGGPIEHSYYLWGPVNTDIRLSIDSVPFDDPERRRGRKDQQRNVWTMI
jgi:esterase/lipase superfamily enzyme